MVFDFEKAMEDRARIKQEKTEERREEMTGSTDEKKEEETYGIYFALEDGGYFLDSEKGGSPEQAFSAAFQRARLLGKKIDLEKCLIKHQGKLFNRNGVEIE
jgi:hypothetical protein